MAPLARWPLQVCKFLKKQLQMHWSLLLGYHQNHAFRTDACHFYDQYNDEPLGFSVFWKWMGLLLDSYQSLHFSYGSLLKLVPITCCTYKWACHGFQHLYCANLLEFHGSHFYKSLGRNAWIWWRKMVTFWTLHRSLIANHHFSDWACCHWYGVLEKRFKMELYFWYPLHLCQLRRIQS